VGMRKQVLFDLDEALNLGNGWMDFVTRIGSLYCGLPVTSEQQLAITDLTFSGISHTISHSQAIIMPPLFNSILRLMGLYILHKPY